MRKGLVNIVFLIAIAITASFVRAETTEAGSEPLLVVTALAPLNPSPLANLDLLPLPVPVSEARSAGFPRMNLDPRNVVDRYAPAYLRPNTDFRTVGDRLFNVSLYSLVALNVADYLSTREALKYPNLREGNPLMKSIVKNPAVFAAVKIGVSAVSFLSLKNLYKKSKTLAWVVSAASNFAMSYVVSNNMRLINMIKGR